VQSFKLLEVFWSSRNRKKFKIIKFKMMMKSKVASKFPGGGQGMMGQAKGMQGMAGKGNMGGMKMGGGAMTMQQQQMMMD
jgi:hypothetical protein